MSKNLEVVNVGSRKSQLALIQTNQIIADLKSRNGLIKFKIETKETLGDKILDKELFKIDGKSLFTKDLEDALESKKLDLLVHSLKDLPSEMEKGMVVGAIYPRESKYDAVVYHPRHNVKHLEELDAGSVIGTCSLRRIAQLKRQYPNLKFESVRGNLNTRLKKLDEDSKYDALVLAEAGIVRMGWEHRIGEILDGDDALYAVGQGALGIEVRKDDLKTIKLVFQLTDYTTLICCIAERAFTNALGRGGSVPLGVSTRYIDNQLKMCGAVYSFDGKTKLDHCQSVHIKIPEDNNDDLVVTEFGIVVKKTWLLAANMADNIGREIAGVLKKQGADKIFQDARSHINSPSSSQPTNGVEA